MSELFEFDLPIWKNVWRCLVGKFLIFSKGRMISKDWRADMKFSRCSSFIQSECIAVLGSVADQMCLFSRHFSAVVMCRNIVCLCQGHFIHAKPRLSTNKTKHISCHMCCSHGMSHQV